MLGGAGMSIFDDDKSSMDKMQSSFKNLVFEIIYYLISGENFPLILYVLFVAIETIQFFYFAFSDEVIQSVYVVPGIMESTIMG